MHKLRFKYSERNARLVGLIKMEPNTCVSGPDGWAVQCAVEWGRRGGDLPTRKEVLAAARGLSIQYGWRPSNIAVGFVTAPLIGGWQN